MRMGIALAGRLTDTLSDGGYQVIIEALVLAIGFHQSHSFQPNGKCNLKQAA